MAKQKQVTHKNKTSIILDNELNSPKYKCLYSCIVAIIVIFCFIAAVPILWVLISSTKDVEEFYRIPPTIIPQSFHPEKIGEVWKMLNFGRAYLNTGIAVIGTVFFAIMSNGMMGYALSRIKPKGHKWIFKIIFISMMLPAGGTMAAKMKLIVDFPILHLNMINTFWPMWLMSMANCFTVIWYKDYFDSVPQSVIEAARLDGTTDMGIFTRIILPLCKPIIFYQVIVNINHAWSDYFWPLLILKDKSLQTVMVRALALQGKLSVNENLIMLTLVMIPPMIFFVIFQKYLMEGMDTGAVKG